MAFKLVAKVSFLRNSRSRQHKECTINYLPKCANMRNMPDHLDGPALFTSPHVGVFNENEKSLEKI